MYLSAETLFSACTFSYFTVVGYVLGLQPLGSGVKPTTSNDVHVRLGLYKKVATR